MKRPQKNEYAAYYDRYISLSVAGHICDILAKQQVATESLLAGLDEEKGNFRYAPDKWSLKEVIGHVIDTERVFNYRALCFARNDPADLPSMDQDDFAGNANFAVRSIEDILQQYLSIRQATLALFRSFDEEIWQRTGMASGNKFSTRAVAYIVAGHELHHVQVIREKYL